MTTLAGGAYASCVVIYRTHTLRIAIGVSEGGFPDAGYGKF